MILVRTPFTINLLNPSSSSTSTSSTSTSLRLTTTASAASSDTQTLPQSAIRRIADKLRSLGYVEDNCNNNNPNPPHSTTSSGQIFIPLPTQLPKYRVGHTLDDSWTTPETPVPRPGSGNAIQRYNALLGVAMKEKEEERARKGMERRERVPSLAELALSSGEIKRLISIGVGMRHKLKVGKAGITEGILNGIYERWRTSEVVKIRCEDVCRLNMKRTHDLLEKKTGGLVVWRSGSNIVLYRGVNYKYPYFSMDDNTSAPTLNEVSPETRPKVREDSSNLSMVIANPAKSSSSSRSSHPPLIQGVGSPSRVRFQLPGEAQLVEEADRLLEGLGPRFTDWWGYDPTPVDADLLPAVVPGYRRPFRLLPYGVTPKLTNDEMTTLKRLGRPLPCHFALGRNTKLQGLAIAVIKLWEKCEIAKVVVKRGVQNMNSNLMAEELKRLTGGILLSRDKEFITLYRGKDFLPAAVSSALQERRKHRMELERKKDENTTSVDSEENQSHIVRCTSKDLLDAQDNVKEELASEQSQLKSTAIKLSTALAKKASAEKLLAELDKEEISKEPEVDKEGIIEEERYMLRKVGLRMKPFLLMGRRGVFDGTIENMHLHWKYRELVKIIVGSKTTEEVHEIARTLETESGGILVAVERVSKGHAIIVYRGKNYQRPASLRPQSLLSKREAMKRSIEAQRRESLKLHVLKLSRSIDELQLQLTETKDSNDLQLAKDVEPGLIQDQENKNVESTKAEEHESVSAASSQNCTGNPYEQQDISTAPCTIHSLDGSVNSTEFTPPDEESDILQFKKQQFDLAQKEALPGSVRLSFLDSSDARVENGLKSSDDHVENSGEEKGYITISDLEAHAITTTSRTVSSHSGSGLIEHNIVGNEPTRPCRALNLSNRERLLLRKQALKARKRTVFALGKGNIVSGLAKAIKGHFEKHPLAIVNVKGRAKGTSVREVVLKLEEATGASLVSQEPSKIILYRGWGAAEEPAHAVGEANRKGRTGSASYERIHKPTVSQELISAIRLECGLQGLSKCSSSDAPPCPNSVLGQLRTNL
ncbi:hypothetical protein LIER_02940 [Lithospermum erythrorhizon]|uniref:CRM domain-containing protein n=1 Tax=Lithospermum erythrorhizon TaxID=34254 RepID=A0AAV3NRF2_LITER